MKESYVRNHKKFDSKRKLETIVPAKANLNQNSKPRMICRGIVDLHRATWAVNEEERFVSGFQHRNVIIFLNQRKHLQKCDMAIGKY